MARKTGSVVETPKPDVNFFEDDSYELLAKGIGGYNQGAATFSGNQSWIDTLIATSKNSNTVATAIEYALDILHSADKGIALPYRQYIWKGGIYAADLKDAQGNPDPKAGQDWCFGYGEEEWLNPAKHPVTGKAMVWKDYKDVANSNLDKRVDCE